MNSNESNQMITKNYTLYKKELKFKLSISIFSCFFCWYFFFLLYDLIVTWIASMFFRVRSIFFTSCCVKYCACFGIWLNTRLLYWFYLNWDATIGFFESVCLVDWLLSPVYQGNWRKVNVFVCFFWCFVWNENVLQWLFGVCV